jgi:uncharacterized RDD family membrane protein YckC
VKDGDRITIGETDIVIHITAPPAMQELGAGATLRIDSARLQCPSCGAELPVHAEICPRCGHRMGGAEAMGGATTAFDPRSMPALGPALAGPAAPPPPSQGPLAPPRLSRTEIYREAAPVASAVPEHTVRESFGSELLPPIGEEALRPPAAGGPPPPPPHAPPLAPRVDLPGGPPAVPPPPAPAQRPAAAAAAVAPPRPGLPAGIRPAGFWIRLVAVLLDALWINALVFGLSIPFGGPRSTTGATVIALGSLLLGIAVPLLALAVFGATPGKALLGLRVIAAGRPRGIGFVKSFLRLCGMMVSGVVLGIGYLMVAFSKDKRALHDHLADTMVIRR